MEEGNKTERKYFGKGEGAKAAALVVGQVEWAGGVKMTTLHPEPSDVGAILVGSGKHLGTPSVTLL